MFSSNREARNLTGLEKGGLQTHLDSVLATLRDERRAEQRRLTEFRGRYLQGQYRTTVVVRPC